MRLTIISLLRIFGKIFFYLCLVLLCLYARLERIAQVFSFGTISYLDSDCYTRMFRVKQLMLKAWPPMRFHTFENYPLGIISHATVPMDYLILALAKCFNLFQRDRALDLAGALISPLLGLCLLIYLIIWTRPFFSFKARIAALIAYSLLPALAWMQNIGRPDHQSLIVLCLTIAITLEANLSRRPNSLWIQNFAALAWGLAFWTSLYEPGLLFLVFFIIQTIRLKSNFFLKRPLWWGMLSLTLLLAFLVEGRIWFRWPTQNSSFFLRWLSQIGELQPLDPLRATLWFGAWIWILPILFFSFTQTKLEKIWLTLFAPLTLFLIALTFWQMRWSGFLAIFISIVVVPWLFQFSGRFWQTGVALLLSIPFIAYIFHSNLKQSISYESHDLKQIASKIKTEGGILAAWWQSPVLLYFSGAPIVASSSHESLSGIEASCRFFTSVNWQESETILKERQVKWIVIGDPHSLLEQSYKLLGLSNEKNQYAATLAARLYTVKAVPTALKFRAAIQQFRLYEYAP